MKKIFWISIGLFVLVVVLLFLRGNEDSWIKDARGVYVKHGNPASVPDYVTEQQNVTSCAIELYNKARDEGAVFNSQCLGACGDYAVDVVHVPRNDVDNLVENQCADYTTGKLKHFIELDNDGEIVRIQ
jgi:hypothetical protein